MSAESRVAVEMAETAALIERLSRSPLPSQTVALAQAIVTALNQGGKVFAFGNGGSAAHAQHFVAELQGRFKMERAPLAAMVLPTDISSLTAIGNDYSFDDVFSREIEGLGNPGDVALGITTSGKSRNVLKAVAAARSQDMKTALLVGGDTSQLQSADHVLSVPSEHTSQIQECHSVLIHRLCELIETSIFGNA